MEKVYILLEWKYDGDSYLFNDFQGAFLTRDETEEKANELYLKTIKVATEHEIKTKYVSFINYKTRETSDVFIEGYEPEEFGNYNETRYEIREIVFKDYSDWDIENPELIECCIKCSMPNKQVVRSKISPTTGYYLCLCGWGVSKVNELRNR